jgi:Tol biopolymer transport system component
MKKTAFILVLFALQTAILFSQPLTVSEIMAEPSVAGMRVESERLSPDGKTVVFLWNAEGKMPLDLYLVSTSGGVPRKILSPPDLQNLRPQTERENKLDYGVIVRDEFVKARENQIGNIAFSPDSKKLLLAQNGDLFVLNITRRSGSTTSVFFFRKAVTFLS